MQEKLADLARRFDELTARMGDPDVYAEPGLFQKIAREAADLEPLVKCWRTLEKVVQELADARELLDTEDDADMRALAEDEITELDAQEVTLRAELRILLLPKDPNDSKNVVIEIRAGTGGEEAALFSADLFRMYGRFAEKEGWRVERLAESVSDTGGFKEVVALVSGKAVYSTLKFESGVHRVQRVPATESQGRIHTSACTVAVLPEAEDIELDIPDSELRIDVYRSSGPGGQSVNTTDSAVRITHIPTGLVVTCQDEKSQHKNKAKALKVLRSRLLDQMQASAAAERSEARRTQVGSGDRSERIRTYNYPQNRVTDHRIGLTLYKLNEIIEGDINPVILPVREAHQAELLNQKGD
ncbi:MAG: peptide chain release factor 1 [Myxococcales bacterium]|nr:peptide chain release factor 1 [Myxococcales bacterium]|tara:strand:- start:125 stop:1195 length:1071 start_codon:yes stop_codon:yes gene_type:complete